MKIKDLIIYPIKSIGGLSLDKITAQEEGFENDRRMMLTDKDGVFVTQREFPKMALVGSKMESDGFTFFDKTNIDNKVFIPFNSQHLRLKLVRVWKHEFMGSILSNEYAQWFSDFLESTLNLVKMNEDSIRKKSLTKSPSSTLLSMADGYPYLVISQASLDDLNKRLETPLSMDRFRPNIVIEDALAYGEEDIDKFQIGSVPFRMIKPCTRCVMTTINQKTGEKLVEPLKTLSTYKKKHNKIYFGMNAVNLRTGSIAKGDLITI